MTTSLDLNRVLSTRNDLQIYGDNARLLLALEMRFQLEDIDTIATNSLVDGSDDCKCDLIYVDRDSGIAVVAQGYESRKPSKAAAKADKAGALAVAAGWLLGRPLNELPIQLRSATAELREAIRTEAVRSLQFWYVHNLPESKNVQKELVTVESTVQSLIEKHFPNASLEIQAIEVGTSLLQESYEALKTPILVSDAIKVKIASGYEVQGENWQAFVTAVPANWLRDMFLSYKDRLFSANLRGYLGSKRAATNINHAIKQTAENQPGYFWVFNNGITGIVHEYKHDSNDNSLELVGLSIVNGAQTTGAIGSLRDRPNDSALVQARFVKCSEPRTIDEIIKFNNSQNPVEASDFRSNDQTQKRLRQEFEAIPNCKYHGGRRGGNEDVIRRQPNVIPSDTAAQSIAAFHNSPVVAYNEKSQIWLSDELYSRFFGDDTHADHIVFAYALLRCVQHKKSSLMLKARTEASLTEAETLQLEFLRKRGATFLLVSAIAACLETILATAVPNRFRISFGNGVPPLTAQTLWEPIVEATISFCGRLSPAITGALNNPDESKKAIEEFRSMVEAVKLPLSSTFLQFASFVKTRT